MKSNKENYRPIINKILLRTSLVVIAMVCCIIILYSIGRGNVSDKIVQWISENKNIDSNIATLYYWNHVRVYLDYILIFIGVILLILFFRIFLKGFTKYFDEIIQGIDRLAFNDNEKINMSPELEFVENKLNQVKERLEKSSRLEKELEKRKSDLIIYLAHDIKTPLTSVIGYLNLLEESPNMDIETRSSYLNITLEKAYRLEKLINEFFEITRYTLQTVPLKKENIDLCYMMVQIVDELYPIIRENEKEVFLEVPEDLILNADSEKVARLFNNLLKNAIFYSEEKSEIKVWAKETEKNIEIFLKNKGTISEKERKNIFEKFYRVDNARQSRTGGFGLGLAIAKDIVLLHEGTIEIECEEGETLFKICFKR